MNEVGRRIEEIMVSQNEQTANINSKEGLEKRVTPFRNISWYASTYLEMKTSSIKEDKQSTLRYFYYSNVDKIKANARHLLLNISVTTPWILENRNQQNIVAVNENIVGVKSLLGSIAIMNKKPSEPNFRGLSRSYHIKQSVILLRQIKLT